jgi:hypothetical protein
VSGQTAEATEARPVVERLCELLVGEIVPRGEPKGLEQGQGRPGGLTLAEAERPASRQSTSAQLIRAATSSSDEPPRGSALPSARSSYPI